MTNRRILQFTLASLAFCLSGEVPASRSASAAGYCDPSLVQVTDNPLGYRDRGDRCEGVYVKEVGGTTLLVASLTESFGEYNVKSDNPLKLEWDRSPGNGNVRVRAQGLRRRLYYRMDTVLPPGSTSYVWSSGVLSSLNVAGNDLGIVALTQYSVGQRDLDVYMPLRVAKEGKTIRTGRYNLVLLPGVELAEIFISLASTRSDGQPEKFIKDGEKLGYGYYPAERGIEIPISELKRAGLYYLEIAATLRSGGSSTVELWFYHSP